MEKHIIGRVKTKLMNQDVHLLVYSIQMKVLKILCGIINYLLKQK